METAPSTLKVTLCGARHPYLPRVIVFPSWPFLLILPQFEVGGARVRFRNCVLPPFLPMSFPKAHASHLSLYSYLHLATPWNTLSRSRFRPHLSHPFLVPWAPLSQEQNVPSEGEWTSYLLGRWGQVHGVQVEDHLLLMMWSYPSHFLSFSVSFHICKMGVRTPYSQSFSEKLKEIVH